MSAEDQAICSIHGVFYSGYNDCPTCLALADERTAPTPERLTPVELRAIAYQMDHLHAERPQQGWGRMAAELRAHAAWLETLDDVADFLNGVRFSTSSRFTVAQARAKCTELLKKLAKPPEAR